jgi:hypothetical protein
MRIIGFFRIYLLALLLSFISGLILVFFFDIFKLEKPVNIFLQSFTQRSWFYQIALASLYAPIVEETQFRLCLNYSKIKFAAFSGIWFYYFMHKFMHGYGLFGEHDQTSLAIGLCLILMAAVYSFLHEHSDVDSRMEKFWEKHHKALFYVSVIGFGFLHVTNFEGGLYSLLLTPVITLRQTCLGFMLGYVRLKYGFLYSVLLHSAYNLSFFLFYFAVHFK